MEHENCCYAIYADETTHYVVANNTAEVLEVLEVFGYKYLLKVKIKTFSSGLKKELENGNPLVAPAESAKRYSQLRFYLTFYFRINISICIFHFIIFYV